MLYGKITRKRFSEKPIVAFTNRTVFTLDFYIYEHVCLVSCFGLECPQKTIPHCIRYIIGVLCYNFKSQTNILALHVC